MPSPAAPRGESPWQQSRWKRSAGVVLFAAIVLVGSLVLSSIGLQEDIPRAAGPISMLGNAIGGGVPALLYMIAAFGWGRLVTALMGAGLKSRGFVQLGAGFALMLWISHGLGVLGLLSDHGPLGTTPFGPRVVGWLMVAIGLALVGHQVAVGPLRPERWPVFPTSASVWAPALALTIVAACNPPGSLWASEFGGYDALSYHLQLPKEWAAGEGGRLWPVPHNVYSFLPSYMESAYLHLGAMSFDSGAAVQRMVGGESTWVYAAQFLHMLTGLVAAIMVARVVSMLAARAGASASVGRWAGLGAGAMLLAMPWTVVVGSLAYNDLAVVAMLGASLLVAFDVEIGPRARAMAVGWMMGIACSAKPTALFMAAPVAGLVLLANLPRGRWLAAAVMGSLVGLLAMAPWLVRNALASGGNPVFPFATSIFGTGWWSAEQVARYTHAHFFDGSLTDRLSLLLGQRGLGNAQWAIAPVLGVAGLGVSLAWKRMRSVGVVLLVGTLIQVMAWLFLSHIQSRFLLPLIAPAAISFGVGIAGVLTRLGRAQATLLSAQRTAEPTVRRVAAGACLLLPLCLAGWSAVNFTQQIGGHPNRLLIAGVGGLTGMSYQPGLAAAPPSERALFLVETPTPIVYLNLEQTAAGGPSPGDAATDDKAVYLLGDATPLYMLGATGGPNHGSLSEVTFSRIVYHTTWDASPLGEAIRANPEDVGWWSRWMIEHGIGRVLVNAPELHRLIERNHYYDPDVTLERVSRWLSDPASGLRSIRRWPGGYELFEIVGRTGESRGAGGARQ